MKKKKIANIVMVVIIIAVIAAGVIGTGFYKGWFDRVSADTALLCDIRGITELERDGIAYFVSEETVLRCGDRISVEAGATVRIRADEGYITLGQSATVEIVNPDTDRLEIFVEEGEVFVDTELPMTFIFDGKESIIENAVATLSVRHGVQSISVYNGRVDDAEAGNMVEWLGNESSVRKFSINSLNDFNIAQLRRVDSSKELIFTLEDLDELEAHRWAQLQIPDSTEISDTPDSEETSAETENVTDTEEVSYTEEIPDGEETSYTEEYTDTEEIFHTEDTAVPAETTIAVETTKPKETTQKETVPSETTPPEPQKLSCTITIRCDTILDNYDELDPAKAPYVPENGCILPVTTVEFTKGETVFEVLNHICKQYGIQIEYSWTPMYDSYYIEGINNLYEFDCGFESGWMYKVNGWFPNYGCSSYELTGGENIVWCYTCKGLGEDVGAERWE